LDYGLSVLHGADVRYSQEWDMDSHLRDSPLSCGFFCQSMAAIERQLATALNKQ